MKKWIAIFCASLFSLPLSGCATQDLNGYSKNKPTLDLVNYFVGTTDAWGMFQKRGGHVVKRFHVVIVGKQVNGQLVLDEHFTYDDGTTQQRVWTLVPSSDGSWTGTADDVVGSATGQLSGNTLRWQYVLALPVDGKTYELHVDDWMYLLDDTTLLNRSSMTKWGFEVGQVTLFFKKRS